MRKILLFLTLCIFTFTTATIQPVNAGNVDFILIDFELETPSHYDPDWEVPCYRLVSYNNPMPALDRLHLYVQPLAQYPSHTIFSDPSQETAVQFNFGRNDVQYSEKSVIVFTPFNQFVFFEDIYMGNFPQGIAILQDGMKDSQNNTINFENLTGFHMIVNLCYVPFADWDNIELTITTAVSGEGFLDWVNNFGYWEDFTRPIQLTEGQPYIADELDMNWLIAFFGMFSMIFNIELLPGLRVGFIVAIPIIFSVFFWFLRIARR